MEDELGMDSSGVGRVRWIERTLAASLVFISLMYLVVGSREYGIYNLLALPLEIVIVVLGFWVWWRTREDSMSDSDVYPPELLLTCRYCGAAYQYGESSVLPDRVVVCQNCALTFSTQ
jgi:hypothetical protein